MNLTTTDSIEVVTSAAAAVDVVSSFIDFASPPTPAAPGVFAISSATTTTVVSAPGSGIRNTKFISIRNKDAALSVDITVQLDRSGTNYEMFKQTLTPGMEIMYIDGASPPFQVFNPAATGNSIMTSAEASDGQRVLQSCIDKAAVGTFLTISGTAYFVYVGRVTQTISANFVEFYITTAGAGTDTKEVGLFSSTTPPNKAAKTLTKIAATGTVNSGVATGVCRNTAGFAQSIPAGTHLWAAYRGALGTTQPTVAGLAGDFSQGNVLTTTGGGALTGVSTASGTIPAIATATIAPDLRVTLD